MAAVSTFAANKILDAAFNGTAFQVTTPFLALWTSTLTAASTGSTSGEAAYTGYARQSLLTLFGAASAGSKTNSSGAVTFPGCTAGTSTVTFFGVLDASTAGNLIFFGTIPSVVISTTATPPTVPTSALTFSLT